MLSLHNKSEKNSGLLAIFVVIVVSIGAIVEIVPLFYLENTVEEVDGVRPYSPLELAGRNIYIREGCYLCHSQMIRPFRDEVERYGHYSIAAESKYDHPFQWGSKRTGPDLARIGGRYSNEWHVEHMRDPRSVVPESVMPAYAFLETKFLNFDDIDKHLIALRRVGVPYSDDMIEKAHEDISLQVNPDAEKSEEFMNRYPKAVVANFDNKDEITELDALLAYLQMLGTLVDFSTYEQPER